MRRTLQGNVRASAWGAKHAGAWAAGMAVIWTVLAPSAAQGQSAVWLPQGATSGNIYYKGGNVGVGPSGPLSEMMIGGGGGYATLGYSAYFDGSAWHGSGMEMTFGPTTVMIGSIASGQPTMLAYWTSSGDVAMGLLNGRVGIGTTNLGSYKLAVESILTR